VNLLLLDPGEVGADGAVWLTGRRAQHLRKVLRVEPGRELRVGVVGGGRGRGRVVAVGAGEERGVTLEVAIDEPPPPPSGIDLILALPRPAVLHRVLQASAAMGIGRLDLVNAWRVEKSFFGSPALEPEAIRRHLLLGAEQGMTTRLPEVAIHKLLVPFVEGLAAPEPTSGPRLLAHPEAERSIEEAFAELPRGAADGTVWLAVGPEGGWIGREVETFGAAGFEPVRLGGWILRVETAVAAALAQIELLRRLART
jgi:RsmE family RNA methyltransferase